MAMTSLEVEVPSALFEMVDVGDVIRFAGKSFAEWKAYFQNEGFSIGVVDAGKFDFRLRPESPHCRNAFVKST
jgi:hypothetical protein